MNRLAGYAPAEPAEPVGVATLVGGPGTCLQRQRISPPVAHLSHVGGAWSVPSRIRRACRARRRTSRHCVQIGRSALPDPAGLSRAPSTTGASTSEVLIVLRAIQVRVAWDLDHRHFDAVWPDRNGSVHGAFRGTARRPGLPDTGA